MKVLVHYPSLTSLPDAVFWEEEGSLKEFVAENSYSLPLARFAMMRKPADVSWGTWFTYWDDQDPWHDVYRYLESGDASPERVLETLRAGMLAES